jgi:hypothetical protein
VVRFLKHALSQIPGKLLIIWDGVNEHLKMSFDEH